MEPDNHLFLEKGNIHLPNLHFLGFKLWIFQLSPRKELVDGWFRCFVSLSNGPELPGDIRSFSGWYCWWFRNPKQPVEGGWQFTPHILTRFCTPSKRSLGRGVMVAINSISIIFYFHPEPWGRCSPILTAAYFSDGLGKTHQLVNLPGCKRDAKIPCQEADSFESNQLHRSQGWQWRGKNQPSIHRSKGVQWLLFQGNSVYRLIYMSDDLNLGWLIHYVSGHRMPKPCKAMGNLKSDTPS